MADYYVEKGVIFVRRQLSKSELREQFEALSIEEQACLAELAKLRERKTALKALLESELVSAIKE